MSVMESRALEKYKSLFDYEVGWSKDPRSGLWLTSNHSFEALDAASTFQLRSTDVLSATFPKTGKHYLTYVMLFC